VFAFLWESLVPQIICVVAYWKILRTLRRKTNVTPAPRRQITAAKEPVAGTSKAATKPVNTDGDTSVGGKAASEGTAATAGPSGSSPGLLKAERNVVKTMIYIIITFFACSMPMDFYFFFRKFAVFIT